MEKIPLNWISTFLYCKRKLYLEEVRKLKNLSNIFQIKNEIKNDIFNTINFSEGNIVKSIKSYRKLSEISLEFRKYYSDLVQKILKKNSSKLSNVGLSITEFFHEIWPNILKDIEFRSSNVFNFMAKEKIYSDELWSKLYPKYLSEIKLESEKLIGNIGRIEIYPDFLILIEFKQGSAPKEGVWPGDKAQIEAAMLLAEKAFGKKVKCGELSYLDSKVVRNVVRGEFIEEVTFSLLDNITKTLKGDLPDFVKNRNKCNSCSLKKKCYSITE